MNDFLKKVKRRKWSSAGILASSFITLIFTGTLLLKLPAAATTSISLTDALFTSTSAVCITGLSTLEIASSFTLFGQIVILILMQAGALGILTFSAFIIWIIGQRPGIGGKMLLEYSFLPRSGEYQLKNFIFFIIKYTFAIELLGALAYFVSLDEKSLWQRAFSAVFHAVSSFTNASYTLYPGSFSRYHSNITVNIITMVLIILGGIGFVVVFEMRNRISLKKRLSDEKDATPRFSLHSWLVIRVTIFLILFGAAAIFLFELLAGSEISLMGSIFHSVASRTAGFQTVDISTFSRGSLLIIMFLMFVGGSPGSTAGGIKTTTFALFFYIMFVSRNNFSDVTIRNRKIPESVIFQALLIFFFSLAVIFLATLIVTAAEPDKPFLPLLFETVSAYATTGFSLGITSELSIVSRYVIIVTMFVGRLGSLTIFSLFAFRRETPAVFAEEKIVIG